MSLAKKICLEKRKLEVVVWSAAVVLTAIPTLRWRITGCHLSLVIWGVLPYIYLFRTVSLSFEQGYDRLLGLVGRIMAFASLIFASIVFLKFSGLHDVRQPQKGYMIMLFVGPVYVFVGGSLILRGLFFLVARSIDKTSSGCACRSCAYDLTGNVSGVCPECGTEIETKG